jgi:hypothetical protein
MKTNVKKSLLSVAAMAIFSLCLTINANASGVHTVAVSDTGKMSKMSKMSKPSKMKAKKAGKMSKMSKDSSKMSKM